MSEFSDLKKGLKTDLRNSVGCWFFNLICLTLFDRRAGDQPDKINISPYYSTLLPRVQTSRKTSTNNRYLYSPHSSRPREVQNLGKSEFWEKKLLDNKSLIRRFGV